MDVPKPLPTQKTLPYWIIAVLVSAIGALSAMYVTRENQCAAERKELRAEYQAKLDACNAQNRADAREAASKLTAFMLRTDSINRVQNRALEKIRKR